MASAGWLTKVEMMPGIIEGSFKGRFWVGLRQFLELTWQAWQPGSCIVRTPKSTFFALDTQQHAK